MADRLDRPTMDVIRRAWTSLLQGLKNDPVTGESHFTDNESDTGFLKDVDALNALIEPFVLAYSSFVDPPLKLDDLTTHVHTVLSQIKADPQKTGANGHPYCGFSANPYPYVQVEVDFVDSASSVLRLNCNVADLFSSLKKPIPKQIEKDLVSTSCAAVDFLISSCIEDRLGARWPAFVKKVDPPGMFANLFFTNSASLALARALDNPHSKAWIGQERRDRIEPILSRVATWTAQQYNSATTSFWMDEGKTSLQTTGILYALEILYALADPMPDDLRSNCAAALASIVGRMTDLSAASTLQRDFFHSLPLPSGPGVTFYDDRRYVGAFLGLFTQAKKGDPNVVNDSFIKASEILFQGITDEWIDEPSSLWDDGRPLICFSQDSLVGLVKYSLEGRVEMVNLPEFELRTAIKDALKTENVIDAIFETLVEKAKLRRNQEMSGRLSKKS
jgi:hypothetical protein